MYTLTRSLTIAYAYTQILCSVSCTDTKCKPSLIQYTKKPLVQTELVHFDINYDYDIIFGHTGFTSFALIYSTYNE